MRKKQNRISNNMGGSHLYPSALISCCNLFVDTSKKSFRPKCFFKNGNEVRLSVIRMKNKIKKGEYSMRKGGNPTNRPPQAFDSFLLVNSTWVSTRIIIN